MKKIRILVLAIISLLISLLSNFKSKTLVGFILSTLIFSILFFVSALSINLKGKKNNKLLLSVLILIIVIIGLVARFVYLSDYNGQLTIITPPHFRMNILTGKCSYEQGTGNNLNYPWFYKFGCDSDKEKKIESIKNSFAFESAKEKCETDCEDPSKCGIRLFYSEGEYCSDMGCEMRTIEEGLTCSDLF